MLRPFYESSNGQVRLYHGSVLGVLPELDAESVQTCVTSPPYLGLRAYGAGDAEIGKEKTVAEYVETMVAVADGVRRVLRNDGTFWMNLGDSFASGKGTCHNPGGGTNSLDGHADLKAAGAYVLDRGNVSTLREQGLKPKDMCLVPARVAIALQENGWWVRSDIHWTKPNGMPGSQEDRPTCSHEYIWLLSKSANYFYDRFAVRRPPSEALLKQIAQGYKGESLKGFEGTGAENASSVKSRIINGAREKIDKQRGHSRKHQGFNDRWDDLSRDEQMAAGSQLRDVWEISPQPFIAEYCTNCKAFFLGMREVKRILVRKVDDQRVMTCPKCGSEDHWVSHFAVFPEEIPTRAIKAGTSERGACEQCGSPYERLVEKGEPCPEPEQRNPSKRLKPGQAGNADAGNMGFRASKLSGQEMAEWKAEHPDATIGWQPTCKCSCEETKPCTVLDCFNGSGRTGIAAIKLGRNYIGVDLNEHYLEMAALQFERLLAQPTLDLGVAS